jgi:hypothetical protein
MDRYVLMDIMSICKNQDVAFTKESATDLLRTLQEDGSVQIGHLLVEQIEDEPGGGVWATSYKARRPGVE